MSSPLEDKPEPLPSVKGKGKTVNTHPKVIPTDFSSVHVDKIMLAINHPTNMITMTLLQQNLQPQFDEAMHEWKIAEERWKVVGEIKMTEGVFNAAVIYYISEMTGGLNIIPLVQQYIKEHPENVQRKDTSYGPTNLNIMGD